MLSTGARAGTADDVVTDVEVLIVSVPLNRVPAIRPLIDKLPFEAIIIDTSNYYPMRDEHIPALDNGKVESLWIVEQLGRPAVKAWNTIVAGSLENKGTPAGDPNRIAIPVAADRQTDKAVTMRLVEETGFNAFDSGTIAESWRQQPGCTRAESNGAIASSTSARRG
jgi:predicted dinucleotide-binding enzyme